MFRSSEEHACASAAASSAPLARDQRGAMFLMCIPICFFMIGMLYFVIGLGEGLIMRERIQDAADAGALSAAIVHARAMNLIALLNVVMAAMVGILIMVRLLEVLLMAAMAIAAALAYFTGGASLSIVPGCEAGREEAHNAWEGLKQIVEPIVEIIHAIEVGVQYGMPIIAEARVLTMVPMYKPVAAFGFAIPGNYPLPVTNGTWQELCKKGGEKAGDMLGFPIRKLIPIPQVADVIRDGIGALTGTFSDEFCGHGGTGGGITDKMSIPTQLPDVKIKQKVQKSYPELTETNNCSAPINNATGKPQVVKDANGVPQEVVQSGDTEATLNESKSQKEGLCKIAAEAEARAMPGNDGKASTTCSYDWPDQHTHNPCKPCVSEPTEEPACPEFMAKVNGSGKECKPGATEGIKQWNYVTHDLTWTVELTAVPGCGSDMDKCTFTAAFKEAKPTPTGSHYTAASSSPCGPTGHVGPQWRTNTYHGKNEDYDESDYLCVEPHTEVEPSMVAAKGALTIQEWRNLFKSTMPQRSEDPNEPNTIVMVINNNAGQAHWTEAYGQFPSPPPPKDYNPDAGVPWPPADQPPNVPGLHIAFIGSWTAVAYVHSCNQQLDNFKDSQEYKEQVAKIQDDSAPTDVKGLQNDECNSAGESAGEADNVHLKMEKISKSNVLGGEDFQMRVIAIRSGKDSGAKRVVQNIPLRVRADESKEKRDPLGAVGSVLGRIFAAQAEYYYDANYKAPKNSNNSQDEADDDSQNKKLADNVDEDRGEWTWNMKWKARIRRLRFLPESNDGSDDEGGGGGQQQGPGSGCIGDDTMSANPTAAFEKGKQQSGASQEDSSGEGAPSSGEGALDMLKHLEDVIVH